MKLISLLRNRKSGNAILVSFTRFIASFAGAFVFNIPWLILFISFGKSPGTLIRIALWCLAPLLIAGGYSYGIAIYDRIVFGKRDSLTHIMPWILPGCITGEIIFISSGPMVIGLSIFVFGGIAVLTREFIINYNKRHGKIS
jgi:hypothetical protein